MEKNFIEAAHWFRMAAEQGDAEGQYHGGSQHQGSGSRTSSTEIKDTDINILIAKSSVSHQTLFILNFQNII